MFCCWLRACHVRSLHKGTALLHSFSMCRLHLTFSCIADRLCRVTRSGRRRSRIVRHRVWGSRHSGRSALCVRRPHEGAALLCGFGLYRLPLYAAAVIRLSCGAGQSNPTVILHRRAAARMGFRLGMYGLFLLRIRLYCPAAGDARRTAETGLR